MTSEDNPYKLDGKTILVTGAASGIGRATAILLSKMQAELVLLDMDASPLEETLKACISPATGLVLDLRDTGSIGKKIQETCNRTGKLNGFVHVAGIPYISPLKSLSESKLNDVLKVNTIAGLELAKVFSNRTVSKDPASIVFISSVYGLVGSPANVGYAISKAAIHGMTKSLAIELAPRKIRVNCIAPGFIRSRMNEVTDSLFAQGHQEVIEKLHPLGLGDPDDVALSVAFLLSDASRWITGLIMAVDGGFTAQ